MIITDTGLGTLENKTKHSESVTSLTLARNEESYSKLVKSYTKQPSVELDVKRKMRYTTYHQDLKLAGKVNQTNTTGFHNSEKSN